MRPGRVRKIGADAAVFQPAKKETSVVIQNVPKKIKFELVREVEGQDNPVVVKTRKIEKTQEIVVFRRLKPLPRAYFVRSFIKRERMAKGLLWGQKKVVEYVARCNIYWAESLENDKQIIPTFSEELENLKVSDDMSQMRDGVAALQRFIFDSEFIKVIAIVFVLAIPFGIFLNVLLHIIPAQVVTWQP
jgi:hypothetical protein